MFCHVCGDRQKDDAKFCGSCGTPLLTVTPTAGPIPAPTTKAARSPRAAVAKEPAITTEDVSINAVTIKGTGPDRDGDIHVECDIDIAYSGSLPVPLVRLRWVALDRADGLPSQETEGFDCQSEDLEAGEERTVNQSGYVRFPKGTEEPDFEVRPTVLLYPVEWHALGSLELPEEGRAERDEVTEAGSLQVTRWWAYTTDADSDSATVNVGLYLRNAGAAYVAMAMARCLVQGRKGQPFASELAQLEGLAPGEERLLTANVLVSEDTRSRKGAKLVVKVGSTELPVVVQVPAETCSVTPAEEEPDEDDESEDEDADVSDDESDESDDDERADGGANEHAPGPAIQFGICAEAGEEWGVIGAVFYLQSDDGTETWAYWLGSDNVGGSDAAYVKLVRRRSRSSGQLVDEHHYSTVGLSEIFEYDHIAGKDADVAMTDTDRNAFSRLVAESDKWISFNEDANQFFVKPRRRRQFDLATVRITGQADFATEDADPRILARLTTELPIPFRYSEA